MDMLLHGDGFTGKPLSSQSTFKGGFLFALDLADQPGYRPVLNKIIQVAASQVFLQKQLEPAGKIDDSAGGAAEHGQLFLPCLREFHDPGLVLSCHRLHHLSFPPLLHALPGTPADGIPFFDIIISCLQQIRNDFSCNLTVYPGKKTFRSAGLLLALRPGIMEVQVHKG